MESVIRKRIKEEKELEYKDVICQFPSNMLLELTNMCNDSCLFCANSKCTKKRGIINYNFAKMVLKQAYDLGTREVGFYGTGEPLLDKNLEDYVAYAKSLGYTYVYVTTNGVFLNEDRAQSLINSGIDSIKFSINASNPKDYFLIHGTNDFDKIINNLINLDRLRKRNKINLAIYISYVLTRYTEKDKEFFKDKYQKYVDDIIFNDCLNVAGYMADEIDNYLSVKKEIKHPFVENVCPLIFKNLYVTYEGYLTMCCTDFQNYLAIADLNKEKLQEAWNNKHAQSLRAKHINNNLKGVLCFNCIYNCNVYIEPLNSSLAIKYDNKSWSKENEIKSRVEKWRKM